MRRFLFVVALVLASVSFAAAQEITSGTIEGTVVDSQGLPVPGATVSVTDADGTTRTFFTDGSGRFFAPFLNPNVYSVKVDMSGFNSIQQDDVRVVLGRRTELAMTIEPGGLTEVIMVSGTVKAVDLSSTTAGVVLDAEQFSRIPVGRRLTDTLYLAPGVSDSGRVGNANPSVGGASGLENQYIVDGVNITNSGYGAIGSYSIVFGSLGSGVNFDFVKEVQIKTAGYEAEYGQSTGGVVNVVTKSGSNLFRGGVYGFSRPAGLEGKYTELALINATRASVQDIESQVSDIGFEVGGPIAKDRLFFFGTFNPQWERRTFIALPGFPLREQLGAVDRDRSIMTYSGKATYQINSSNRIDFSAFGDPAKGDNGPQRTAALTREDTAGFSELKYGGHNQIVKWDGVVNSSWLLEASFARAYNKIEETPSVDTWSFTDRTVVPNVRTGGIGFYEVGNEGSNLQYQLKSTHIFGDHQIRYGIAYEDISYDNTIDRTGPPITLHNGERTVTGATVQILSAPELPGGKMWRVVRANTSNVRNTTQEYFNFFVQDTIKVGNRLTLRPGVRYEQQKLVGNLADFQWDGNWAPRLGATYAPTDSGRTKIYANWGRFFAKVPNDLAARALSADAGVTRADYFDAGLSQPIQTGTLAGGVTTHFTTAGLSPADFDPDSKSTYMDETLVGFEHEVLPQLNVGVRYIHRSFGRILEDVGTAPMVSYFLRIPGLDSVEYFITNPSPSTPVVAAPPGFAIAFEEAIHDYDAVEFTADKRFSDGWGLNTSYRWSRLQGTFEGFFRNDNGQSDPAITSLFDFPTNDPSYTELGAPLEGFRGDIRFLGALGQGPLPNDRPHQVKVYFNRTLDMGLNLGMGWFVSSGAPLTAFAANPAYDSPGEIPEGVRGSGITTADGFRKRTEIESSFSFHADYGFDMGGSKLTILADIFNLFDQQSIVNYDYYTESSFTAANPDFGLPFEYQIPRRVRLGVRLTW